MKKEEVLQKIKKSSLYEKDSLILIAKGKPNSSFLFFVGTFSEEAKKRNSFFSNKEEFILLKGIKNILKIKKDGFFISSIIPIQSNKSFKPSQETINEFEFFRKKIIEKNKPKVIFLLGETSFKAFFPNLSFFNYIGKALNKDGINYCITNSIESYIRRGRTSFFYKDLFEAFIQSFAISYKNLPQERIIVNKNNIENVFSLLNNSEEIVFDTECEGLSWDERNIVSLVLGNKNSYYFFNKEIILKERQNIEKILKTSKKLVGHNITFDITVLHKAGISLLDYKGEIEDSMLGWYVIREDYRKGLKYLNELFFNEKFKDYNKINKINKEEFLNYAFNDVWLTNRLNKVINKLIEYYNVFPIYKIEKEAILPVASMTINGLKINEGLLNQYEKEIINKIKEIKEKINIHIPKRNTLFGEQPIEINLNSTKELNNLLFNTLNINKNSLDSTKTGLIKTDVYALEKIKEEHPIVPLIMEYKKQNKLLTSFILPFKEKIKLNKDGKLHPLFNQSGAVTGRFSSESPNAQQFPSDRVFPLRKIIIPSSENKLILKIDYAQEELRVAGIISEDKEIIEAFLKEKDLHLMTANTLFNLKIPEKAMEITHLDYEKYKKQHKKERKLGKLTNFGILYGASSYKVSEVVGCNEKEAKELIRKFFGFYKGISKTIKEKHNELEENFEVSTLFGRHRRFFLIDERAKRQSFNFLIQGLSSDIMKTVLKKIYDCIIIPSKGEALLLLTVHDEVVLEVPKEKIKEVEKKVSEIMCEFDFKIPLKVEATIGENYGS